MRKTLCLIYLLITGAAMVLPSGAANDSSKENEAIMAVIEKEKSAYLALDFAAMADTWVQKPSSMKVYLSAGKETRIDGWDAISAQDKAALAAVPPGASRPQIDFSDYRITVQGDTAWVTHKADWKGVANGKPLSSTQSRVDVLTKEGGKWKFTMMAIPISTAQSIFKT